MRPVAVTLFFIGLPAHGELIEDEPGHSHPAAKKKSPVFSWTIAPIDVPHGTGVGAIGVF